MKAYMTVLMVMSSIGCSATPAPTPPMTPCTPITQETYKDFGKMALDFCNRQMNGLSGQAQTFCLCAAVYVEDNFAQAVARHHLVCQEQGLSWGEVVLTDQQQYACSVSSGLTSGDIKPLNQTAVWVR
jgi:hypothetical protein